MEANRNTAPRRGWLRTAFERLRAARTPRGAQAQAAGAGVAALGLEQTVGAVDFLAHVDRDLRFLYVTDASLRFIGYHREYLETISLHDIVATADSARLEAVLTRAEASGAVEKVSLDLVKSL